MDRLDGSSDHASLTGAMCQAQHALGLLGDWKDPSKKKEHQNHRQWRQRNPTVQNTEVKPKGKLSNNWLWVKMQETPGEHKNRWNSNGGFHPRHGIEIPRFSTPWPKSKLLAASWRAWDTPKWRASPGKWEGLAPEIPPKVFFHFELRPNSKQHRRTKQELGK